MQSYFDIQIKYFVVKKCIPTWILGQDKIDFYDLTFVVGGEATYCIDDKSYSLSKGEGIFIPRDSKRAARTDSNNPLECVAFSMEAEGLEVLGIPIKFCWEESEQLKVYFKEFNVEWVQKNPMYLMKCKALLNLILYELIQLGQETKKNRHVENIKRYIIENITVKLTVNQIAEGVNIHPVYCGALFKEHMQMSIHQYINSIRISKAKELILSEEMPINIVGYAVGIEDPYYFSKLFKDIVGVSPSVYKKSIIG